MNHRKSISLLILVFNVFFTISHAQIVTISPAFATQNDSVTVIFDASQGNQGLKDINADVYAHTGVITDKSTSGSDWKYVQGVWGQANAKTKMTSLGNNRYSLSFDIRKFYGVPSNENIQKLAFVFRNVDGSKKGANSDNSDIFITLQNNSFGVQFITPQKASMYFPDSIIYVRAIAAKSCDLYLFVDDSLITHQLDSQINFSCYFNQFQKSKLRFIVKAIKNGNAYYDTTYVIKVNGSDVAVPPSGIEDGINILNDSTAIFQLYAPGKKYIYLIGDMNNWELDPKFQLKRNPAGDRFWIKISGLQKDKEYRFQYQVDLDKILICEPYSEKILDQNYDTQLGSVYSDWKDYPNGKTTGLVSVFKTTRTPFQWKYTDNFSRPNREKLVIYELLIRDFIGTHSYRTLKDTLQYIKNLGINAIELMPVMEFDGNDNWGYTPNVHYALDKYYGSPNEFKAFVDECHNQGIAVILDIVLNHAWGLNPLVKLYYDNTTGKTTSENPWFNVDATHPYNVGFDFNHESPATQYYVDKVLRYWVNEYRVDGYRFDLAKGFTQSNHPNDVSAWGAYDPTRVAIWKRIKTEFRKTCTDCYMILENFADNSEEKILSDEGFLSWTNLNNSYCQLTMGYNSSNDLTWSDYKTRTWNQALSVVYAESHDEERVMYKNITYGNTNGNYNAKDIKTALQRTEASIPILMLLKGPKMIWQFGELGYDVSINQGGRLGAKPPHWEYFQVPERKRLYEIYSLVNQLKQIDGINSDDYSFNGSGELKSLQIRSSNINVQVVSNFSMNASNTNLSLPHNGWWYNYITNDSFYLNQSTTNLSIPAGQYILWTDKNLAHNKPSYNSIIPIQENTNCKIYPNPGNGNLYIHIPVGNIKNLKLEVYTIEGKQIYHELFLDSYISQQMNYRLNISKELNKNGVYYFRIYSNDNLIQTIPYYFIPD